MLCERKACVVGTTLRRFIGKALLQQPIGRAPDQNDRDQAPKAAETRAAMHRARATSLQRAAAQVRVQQPMRLTSAKLQVAIMAAWAMLHTACRRHWQHDAPLAGVHALSVSGPGRSTVLHARSAGTGGALQMWVNAHVVFVGCVPWRPPW